MKCAMQNVPSSIYLKPMDKHDAGKIIDNFSPKKSTDTNGMNINLIKVLKDNIIAPLTHICNMSLSTGVFPNDMKIGKVKALFKNGERQFFTKYRPFSLLPQVS